MRYSHEFTESCFKTSHEMMIHGKRIAFDAVAEDYVITNAQNEPEASMFSYTYLRTDHADTTQRPVMFVWDGGPGGSCAQQHLNFFGPWRVACDETGAPPARAPYRMEENPHCLLDVCDIVLVDPVGTGYARLLDETQAGKYYSVNGDARAMADFIQTWLTHYGRWNSKIYLCGSSYGTIRCVRVAEELAGGDFYKNGRELAIPVEGMILIGSAVWMSNNDFGAEENSAASVLPAGTHAPVLLMQSMAAVNWYYHKELQSEPQEQFCQRAWAWAWDKLEPVLSGAIQPDEAEKRTLAEEMSGFTGIAPEILLSMDLKLEQSEVFAALLLAEEGKDLGIYDARKTLPKNTYMCYGDPATDDPAMAASACSYVAIVNSELRKKLNIQIDRPFVETSFAINAMWDYAPVEMLVPQIPARSYLQSLSAVMRRNQQARLLFATGTYDLSTWSGLNRYAAEHAELPEDRTMVRTYPSGHSAFVGEAAGQMLEADIRTML